MLKSMTGFGRGEYLDKDHRVAVEIKAVNHRYNEILIRMPKNLGALEDKIRREIASVLVRGRIDVFVSLDDFSEKKRVVRVDKELAIAYHNAMKELADLLSASVTDQVHHIAKYPDVIRVDEEQEDVLIYWPKLQSAIASAVGNLMAMRTAEGGNIQKDLATRIAKISGYIETVEERAPKIVEEYREKLLAKMRDILTAVGVEPDETRILQETAIYADRTNFTEELVRLKSHLAQFVETLNTDDAVGRKLDFIVQEINREVNTIASKANDYTVAHLVVEIKSEIEKVREQIQNIE